MDELTRTPGRYIGIDLGGTNMQVGLVDLSAGEGAMHAEIVATRKIKTKALGGLERVLERLQAAIEEICQEIREHPRDLAGVGIGAPSPVDPYKGIVLEAVNLRWNNVPLVELLERRLGARVFLDNDVNVALVGEAHFGAGRDADPLLGVWVGTGVGGALMLGGRLHYGRHFTGGEIGQMWISPFGSPGLRTLEQFCSRTAMVNRLRALILSNHKTLIADLVEGDLDKIKSKTIGEAYHAGDELTREVADHAGMLLGTQIGSIHTLISLERVVLGGGLTEALGPAWVDLVARRARQVAFPAEAQTLDVSATMLEDNAGILGAAFIAAERVHSPRYTHVVPERLPSGS